MVVNKLAPVIGIYNHLFLFSDRRSGIQPNLLVFASVVRQVVLDDRCSGLSCYRRLLNP